MTKTVKTEKSQCSGCSACRNICPCDSISMQLDDEGFIYPQIDESTCSSCGQCERVCPTVGQMNDLREREMHRVFALRHLDEGILLESTSGGAFSALAEVFCGTSGYVAGAVLGKDFTVKHQLINISIGIDRFRKSKYLQSDVGLLYRQIQELLKAGTRVLFSGTPCQIAGLKAFLRNIPENLLLVEIICHGIPSQNFFNKYREAMEKKYHAALCQLDFRNNTRKRAWKDSQIILYFENGKKYRCSANYDDPFIHGFHAAFCQRPSCYCCSFVSMQRCADITIGDFWGIETVLPSWDDGKGVSLLLCNNEKAQALLPEIKRIARCEELDLETATKNNLQLKQPSKPHPLHEAFMRDLNDLDFNELVYKYLPPRPWYRRIAGKLLSRNIKKIIKKFTDSHIR